MGLWAVKASLLVFNLVSCADIDTQLKLVLVMENFGREVAELERKRV